MHIVAISFNLYINQFSCIKKALFSCSFPLPLVITVSGLLFDKVPMSFSEEFPGDVLLKLNIPKFHTPNISFNCESLDLFLSSARGSFSDSD